MLRSDDIWLSLIALELRLDELLAKAAWLDDRASPWFTPSPPTTSAVRAARIRRGDR